MGDPLLPPGDVSWHAGSTLPNSVLLVVALLAAVLRKASVHSEITGPLGIPGF